MARDFRAKTVHVFSAATSAKAKGTCHTLSVQATHMIRSVLHSSRVLHNTAQLHNGYTSAHKFGQVKGGESERGEMEWRVKGVDLGGGRGARRSALAARSG